MAGPDGRPPERGRIERALISLSAADGFWSVDERGLLGAADVGVEVFRREFGSLERCYAETWSRVDREFGEAIAAVWGREESWEERMRAGLRATLEFLAEDPERSRFYVVEASAPAPEMVVALRDRSVNRVRATIALGIDGEEGRRAVLSGAIAGGVWHCITAMITDGRAAELPSQVPELMYFILLLSRGREVAERELRAGSP